MFKDYTKRSQNSAPSAEANVILLKLRGKQQKWIFNQEKKNQ